MNHSLQPSPSPATSGSRAAHTLSLFLIVLGLSGVWGAFRDAGMRASASGDLPLRSVGHVGLLSPGGPIVTAARRVELAGHETLEDETLVPPDGTPGTVVTADASDLDDDRRRRALGEWTDEYRGKRHLTVRTDGTATMVVEPSGVSRRIFAERLVFQIEWTLANGRLTMTTVGGEPKSKTRLILRLFGEQTEYRVLNVDDDQLLLLDADGKTEYDWRRVQGTESRR